MKYDTFKKTENILYKIRQLKELIGQREEYSFATSKHIKAAEEDEGIKASVEKKINSLQEEFDSL